MKTLWTIVSLLVVLNIGGEVMGDNPKDPLKYFKLLKKDKNYKELEANLDTMRCQCIKALQHDHGNKNEKKSALEKARKNTQRDLGLGTQVLPNACEKGGLLGKSFNKDLHGKWNINGYKKKMAIYGACISLALDKRDCPKPAD